MTYASNNQFKRQCGELRVLQLCDPKNTGEADEDLIEAAIIRASGDIDAKVSTRYVVPLVNPPITLVATCCDIALYHLTGAGLMNEDTRVRYEDGMRFLDQVAKGQAVLVGAQAAGQESAQLSQCVVFESGGSVFTNREDF